DFFSSSRSRYHPALHSFPTRRSSDLIAYSLTRAQTAGALGPEMQQMSAKGKFVLLRVKTWFDERTISARRGNAPLTPNRRKVLLLDATGRSYAPSAAAEAEFARLGQSSTPLTKALRPGESY